jgi:thiamine biosynthesis lipoprotein
MMPSTRSKNQPKPSSPASLTFEALGTHWQIDIGNLPDGTDVSSLSRMVYGRIEAFDQAYSRFRADSIVSSMAQRKGDYRLPDDARPMMTLYRELYELTGGAVTPLVGQLLADAGYDAEYTLRPGTLRKVPSWDDAISYDYPVLTVKRPVLLDFGACGKGYAVDFVASLLAAEGCQRVCVDAGGDMVWRPVPGGAALRVGLEDPDDSGKVIGVAELADGALCGSAGNRRAWDRFHHVMDPRTLDSPRHIRALWVTSDSALLADGLATALFFVSPQRLRKRYTFEYAALYADDRLEHSPGFPGTFFTDDNGRD